MPNHEQNNTVIIGSPANIRRFLAEAFVHPGQPFPGEAAGEDAAVNEKDFPLLNFNLIIPRPIELSNTVSPSEVVATQEEADQKNAEYNALPYNQRAVPQIKYLTEAERLRRQEEYGALDWYGWSLQNWGTKWGAYDHDHFGLRWLERNQWADNPGEIYGRIDLRFQTAWSQPTPIFEAIEEKWGVEVHCVTQDEGGFPDVEYGDPYGQDVIRKVVTFEFENYMDTEVAGPTAEVSASTD